VEVSRVGKPPYTIPQACGRQLQQKRCPPLASMSGARQQERANTPARDERAQQEAHAKRGQTKVRWGGRPADGSGAAACVSGTATSACGALAIAWDIAARTLNAEWRG